MNVNSLGGMDAARQFYQLLRARNPMARARLAEIVTLARQGDLEAIRAIRLLQSAMRSPNVMVGQINNPRPAVTPQQIETLRQMALRARNTPYSPSVPVPASPGFTVPTPTSVPGEPRFPQIPGGVVGYTGEGFYQVIKPGGLGLYSGPTMNRPSIQTLPFESMVRVFAQAENSYVQIDQPAPGYVCMTCAELPGGPWLMRKS